MGWRARCLGFVLVLGAAPRAGAVAPETAAFEYHPAEGCPGEFTFRSQVQARTPLWLISAAVEDASSSSPRLVVWLSRSDRGYSGKLEIWRNGASSPSTLEAPTCDEVVAGLAIAAALDARDRADQAAAPPPAPLSPPAPAPAPVREGSGPLPAPAPYFALQAGGGLRFGYGPGAAPSVTLALARRQAAMPWRVAGSAAWPNDAVEGSSSLSFAFYGGELELCPVQKRASWSSGLLACVQFEGGVMHLRSSSAEVENRPWLAPGAALRFFARFSHFVLEPSLTLRVPLVRDRYLFRPNHQAFRSPVLAGEAGLSLGVAL